MVSVVVDGNMKLIIEKNQDGGSNNIAELIAVKEALLWCVNNEIKEVTIKTDSQNNLAWVYNKKVGKKINDRNTVLLLKNTIDVCLKTIKLNLILVPREQNLAGHYIEDKYNL
mgnify:CR=1 FL=1